MKAQTKALVASLIIVALGLSAVSGITYSWFSVTDETDITIETGKIQVRMVVTDELGESVMDTEGLSTAPINIENMGPGDVVVYNYSMHNTSTIEIKWRLYVSFSVDGENQALADALRVDGSQISSNGYSSSKSFKGNDASSQGTLTISIPECYGNEIGGKTLKGKLIFEVYQANAVVDPKEVESTADPVNTDKATAEIPSSENDAVVITSNLGISVQFDSNSAAAQQGKTLSIEKKTESEVGIQVTDGIIAALYELKIDGGAVSDLGGKVSVTITLPGSVDSPTVYYVDNEDNEKAMPITEIKVVGSNTKVTFVTSHFSMYAVTIPSSLSIGTAQELIEFANKVNRGQTFVGEVVVLSNNIDLSESKWVPIGKGSQKYPGDSFMGTFDGKGYTISGMKTTASGSNFQSAGLFGSISDGAIVKNVVISNSEIRSSHYAGGICGYIGDGHKPVSVLNCKVYNSTVCSTPYAKANGEYDDGDKVGGIVGYLGRAHTIEKCNVLNVTVKAYRDLGGIVGWANGTVNNCDVQGLTIQLDMEHNYMNYEYDDDLNQYVGKDKDSEVVVDSQQWGEIIGHDAANTGKGNTSSYVTGPTVSKSGII